MPSRDNVGTSQVGLKSSTADSQTRVRLGGTERKSNNHAVRGEQAGHHIHCYNASAVELGSTPAMANGDNIKDPCLGMRLMKDINRSYCPVSLLILTLSLIHCLAAVQ